MIRLSAVRNLPVILGDKKLGYVHDFVFDDEQKRVLMLIAACGMRSKRVVFSKDILAMNENFIMIRASYPHKRSMTAVRCCFVHDATGLVAGSVRDYAIDPDTMEIRAIQICTGYLPSDHKRRIWMYSFVRHKDIPDVLSIPLHLCQELISAGEGT